MSDCYFLLDVDTFRDIAKGIVPFFLVAIALSYLDIALTFHFLRRPLVPFPQKIAILLSIIIMHVVLFNLDRGQDLQHHGALSTAIYITLSVVALFILGLIKLLSALPASRRILVVLLLISLAFFCFYSNLSAAKERWPKGLSGTKLEYTYPGCNIPEATNWRGIIPSFLFRFLLGSLECEPSIPFSILEGSTLTVTCQDEMGALVIEDPDYVSRLKLYLDGLGLTPYVTNRTFSQLERR